MVVNILMIFSSCSFFLLVFLLSPSSSFHRAISSPFVLFAPLQNIQILIVLFSSVSLISLVFIINLSLLLNSLSLPYPSLLDVSPHPFISFPPLALPLSTPLSSPPSLSILSSPFNLCLPPPPFSHDVPSHFRLFLFSYI